MLAPPIAFVILFLWQAIAAEVRLKRRKSYRTGRSGAVFSWVKEVVRNFPDRVEVRWGWAKRRGPRRWVSFVLKGIVLFLSMS